MLETRRFKGDFSNLIPPVGGEMAFYGLNLPAAAFGLAQIQRQRPQSFLVIVPTPIEAEDLVRNLEFFWPEGAEAGRILLFPGFEIKPFAGESPAQELISSRLWALWALMSGERPQVVVASAPGAIQKAIPKSVLGRTVEYLEADEEIDRDAFLDFLAKAGYFPTSQVQSQGDFSVRGGIIDLYPPGITRPVRVEFFGDLVESLRTFKTLDQRSVDQIPEQIVLPANEVVFLPESGRKAAEKLEVLAYEEGWLDLLWKPLTDKIRQEMFFPGLESFLPLFYDDLSTLQDYASPEVVRLYFEPSRIVEAADKHLERLLIHMDRIISEERPHLPLSDLYIPSERIFDEKEPAGRIEVRELGIVDQGEDADLIQFQVENNNDLRALIDSSKGSSGMLAPLAARIRSWRERDLGVVLVCHTKEQARRLSDLLVDYELYPEINPKDPIEVLTGRRKGLVAMVGFLSTGFVLGASGLAFITEDELFGPKRRVVRRAAEEVKGVHLSSFQDLNVGDFIVHNDHGIGQYLGLVKLEVEGRSNDYLYLSYKGNDKLYVPVDRFGAVGKYIGADERAPSLDKLGGTSWEKVKAKIKASILEMADELLKLYASRQLKKGHAYTGRDSYFREFEAAFQYEETPDQMGAIEDVLKDMSHDKPMDRLVCGDVGYGKTEVALRAGFKAVTDGKQVAVLVPTTVLAEQHFQTFQSRFNNYPINVEVISRFKKPAEQREIIKKLKEGQVDVIVGTHRLLSKDVSFKDLGLLIVDEEHRFGVAAKEKLKKLRAEVDVLCLSATPIPRTLNLSLTGIRDLSVIETPPQDRRAVKTYLLKYDEATVCEAIARELERGGQVFLVHNRVKDIDRLAARFMKLMPLVRFGVAHGQLKEKDLEGIMLRFVRREIDVLVSTTIIESGLDFPTTNTIIINNADRFGLAQIYQLRGRVGRSTEQAYAYLLVASEENLTRDARKRLRALMDFSELGAGFKIALHDLQIRGAGNLLGSAQSGQIAAVGYEMYVQLMERTIKEIKGEELVEEIEPEMVLGIAAYLPEFYIPDMEQRLIHYRRLSSFKELGELIDAQDELVDRYGPMPTEVKSLIRVMELKYYLKKSRVKKLELGKGGLTLTFTDSGPVDPDQILQLVQDHGDKARVFPEGRVYLPLAGLEGAEGLKAVKNILQGLVQQPTIKD